MADVVEIPFNLPEDLVSNIFIRLPIKSLLISTSVCKTWNSFLKSSSFFSSHLNHTISLQDKNGTDPCLLQLCSLPVDTGIDSFFLCSKDQDLGQHYRFQSPFDPDQIGFQVVASCNGLVYMMHGRYYASSYSYHWILWNPAIRKTMIITERQNARALEAVGLGFDSKTSDYKVLSIVGEPFRDDNLRVNLYSLKANSWKRLPDLDAIYLKHRSLHREMAFVNGALHFIALQSCFKKPRFLIFGFDVADEVFREIMLPDCMNDVIFKERVISKCGESLSVLWLKDHISNMEIWVMKEYGVKESWSKVSTVKLESSVNWGPVSISGLVFKNESHALLSLGSYRYGDTVGRFFLHDLKSQETKEIETDGEHACYYLGNYVESLVLLDGANEMPPEIEPGASAMSNFLENFSRRRAIHDEADHVVNFLKILALYDAANRHPFELGSYDGNDARGIGSSSTAGYVYDHGDLEAEENADLEEDFVGSDE